MKRATVAIIRNTEGDVLLLKRTSLHEHFPDQWCLPGGKLDYLREKVHIHVDVPLAGRWESPVECVVREVLEEVGIYMTLCKDTGIVMFDQHFLVHAFQSLSVHDEVPKQFPNREHVTYGWFNHYNYPKDLGNMTRQLLTAV